MRATSIARIAAAALVVVGTTSACHITDATSPPVPCSAPLTGISIRVTAGSPTQFEWTPDCNLAGIILETAGTTAPGADMWIISDSRSRIEGPVQYGVVPPTATQVLAPVPMVTGQRYRVHLIGADGVELYTADFTQ
ncbi:MAG: hypothetical protein ACJ79K_15050 [Gemmatimonadaceae bacterium]